MLKIHVGCGKRDFGKDWAHVDAAQYPHVKSDDVYLSSYADDSVDVIYASHFIEYFDREEVQILLQAWNRVLKPDGLVRLAVPDFRQIAQLYLFNPEIYPLERFLGPLYGRHVIPDFRDSTFEQVVYHKTVYDFDSLKNVLESNGFRNVRRYNWRDTEHAHIDDCSRAYLPHMDFDKGTLISLNVECNK